LHISTVVLGELYTWAYRRADPEPTRKAIEGELLSHAAVLIFDEMCAHEFGKVRASLLSSGRTIDAVDSQIAATALVHNLTLVTHNTADFVFIPGLRLEDWLIP
jgi:tRNA(fMet)-specific endonuclease VapC